MTWAGGILPDRFAVWMREGRVSGRLSLLSWLLRLLQWTGNVSQDAKNLNSNEAKISDSG